MERPGLSGMLSLMRLALALMAAVVLLAGCGSTEHARSTTVHDLSEIFNTNAHGREGSVELTPFQRAELLARDLALCHREHSRCPGVEAEARRIRKGVVAIKPDGERESIQEAQREVRLCRESPARCPWKPKQKIIIK